MEKVAQQLAAAQRVEDGVMMTLSGLFRLCKSAGPQAASEHACLAVGAIRSVWLDLQQQARAQHQQAEAEKRHGDFVRD